MANKVNVVYCIALNPESLPALALLLSTCFCNDESRTGGTVNLMGMLVKSEWELSVNLKGIPVKSEWENVCHSL